MKTVIEEWRSGRRTVFHRSGNTQAWTHAYGAPTGSPPCDCPTFEWRPVAKASAPVMNIIVCLKCDTEADHKPGGQTCRKRVSRARRQSEEAV